MAFPRPCDDCIRERNLAKAKAREEARLAQIRANQLERMMAFERRREERMADLSELPMYESRYCEPANLLARVPKSNMPAGSGTYVGVATRDRPTEPPHHATEQYEQAPADIAYAIRTETGMRRVEWMQAYW
jgi:hypothetical protein